MEKFAIKYQVRTGTKKDGQPWKAVAILATSEEDGKVYSGLNFSKDVDESQYQDA